MTPPAEHEEHAASYSTNENDPGPDSGYVAIGVVVARSKLKLCEYSFAKTDQGARRRRLIDHSPIIGQFSVNLQSEIVTSNNLLDHRSGLSNEGGHERTEMEPDPSRRIPRRSENHHHIICGCEGLWPQLIGDAGILEELDRLSERLLVDIKRRFLTQRRGTETQNQDDEQTQRLTPRTTPPTYLLSGSHDDPPIFVTVIVSQNRPSLNGSSQVSPSASGNAASLGTAMP